MLLTKRITYYVIDSNNKQRMLCYRNNAFKVFKQLETGYVIRKELDNAGNNAEKKVIKRKGTQDVPDDLLESYMNCMDENEKTMKKKQSASYKRNKAVNDNGKD